MDSDSYVSFELYSFVYGMLVCCFELSVEHPLLVECVVVAWGVGVLG